MNKVQKIKWSDMTSLMGDYKSGYLTNHSAVPMRPERLSNCIILNMSGRFVEPGKALRVTGMSTMCESWIDSFHEYLDQGIVVRGGWQGNTDDQTLAFLTEAALPSYYAKAYIPGAFAAPVYISDNTHKYAKPDGQCSLMSCDSGPYRIITKSVLSEEQVKFCYLRPASGGDEGHLVGTVTETNDDDSTGDTTYTVRVVNGDELSEYSAKSALDDMEFAAGDQVVIDINRITKEWEIIAPSGEGGHLIGVIKSNSSGVFKVQVGTNDYNANSPLASDLDTGLKCAISKNRLTGKWDIIAVECPEE